MKYLQSYLLNHNLLECPLVIIGGSFHQIKGSPGSTGYRPVPGIPTWAVHVPGVEGMEAII